MCVCVCVCVCTDVPDVVNHTEVQSTIKSLREVELSWKEPEDNNAPITEYQLTYCEVLVNDSTCIDNEPVTTNGSVTSIKLTGLQPDSMYNVTIQAINAVGSSPSPPDPYMFPTATATDVTPYLSSCIHTSIFSVTVSHTQFY